MPINLGFFFIRKPRVSPYNATSTRPPTSQGNFSVKPCFRISYKGSGVYSALLDITGKKILTIINESLNHSDNLNIEVIGKTVEELVEEINSKLNYHAEILTNFPKDLCLLMGTLKTNINNTYYSINYNREIEYLIDTSVEGKLGLCSVSYKEEGFTYSGENSRWMIDEGLIYDAINKKVTNNGILSLGNFGVQIKFFPAIDSKNKDINKTVVFQDLELVQSLDSPISETTFSAAPILIDKTLELKINQQTKERNKEYIVDYGTLAEIRTINPSPYTFNNTNNIFRIRHNSFPIQQYILPLGDITAKDLANFINKEAKGYKAYAYLDHETRLEYFSIMAERGTAFHQLRIEDGSSNSILGYTALLSARGESNGKLLFMTHVSNENITPEEKTSNLSVGAIKTASKNPFLGIYTETFLLKENNVTLTKDKDYIVSSNGDIQLLKEIKKEKLISGVLVEDNDLFPNSYTVYDNGKKLIPVEDYRINPQGGWITLSTSAFPEHIYTADYKHKNEGDIIDEVLLGKRANIDSTLRAPYSIPLNKYTLKVSVNNGDIQIFQVPTGNGIVIEDVIDTINATSTDFEAYQSDVNVLSLRTLKYGSKNSITIHDGSLNEIVGFDNFYSTTGSGAKGGEQSLETKHKPLEVEGFAAPEGGDTIIIKNNDVTDRYKPGAIIKLLNDFYQVKSTYLENRANAISSVTEPYTIFEKSNDTFKFAIDNNPETTVIFNAGTNIRVDSLVDQINKVHPNASKAMFVNGIKRVQLIGDNKVIIGKGNVNRTLGFEYNFKDTNQADTFIFINSLFKKIYINPTMLTTKEPVIFIDDISEKEESPQNVNEIKIKGNVSINYPSNTILKIDNRYYYNVKSSSYEEDNDVTLVHLTSKTDIPLYENTVISYSEKPVLHESDIRLKTKLQPVLSEPFDLYKNGSLLVFEKDYEISIMGDIDLTEGLLNGDNFYINYYGRRYIEANTSVAAKYSFFDFLRKGSNIKISYEAHFPDNFYLNVLHASTLMSSFQKESSAKIQQAANSSSSGFPSGEIPVTDNSENGNGSFEYDLGDLNDKITLSDIWYYFFDNRIKYFEDEKRYLKGFSVGAEDGRLTQFQIEDSANNPPTRLFPMPDTRPEEERSEPTKIPCLFGENKNDLGSDVYGFFSDHIFKRLSDEKIKCENEITKLNQLLFLKNTTVGFTAGTGYFDIYGTEEMHLYVEINSSGNLIQNNYIITFTEKFDISEGGGGGMGGEIDPPTHRANTVLEISTNINSQTGLSISSYLGNTVYLNSNPAIPCVYVVVDAPSVGFGNDADASVRSRSPWWTGGYTYNSVVPGNYSVHLDITDQNNDRYYSNQMHTEQIKKLNGIMEEWLPPLDASFNPAKTERSNVLSWMNLNAIATNISNDFNELKSLDNGQIFSSIDNNAILSNRINILNSRINEINLRMNQVNDRYIDVNNSLSREDLFNQRYSWLMILTHRNNGYYADRKRAIDAHNKSLREAENSSAALISMGNFG